jgi:decaprenyl-phosphate phosphoribosyltransferase
MLIDDQHKIRRSQAGARAFSRYFRIARPDHWIKNTIMLPGVALAAVLTHGATLERIPYVALGFIALCLAASANYTINEFLDAKYDRIHPLKSTRPGALGLLDFRIVMLQYASLAVISLVLGRIISIEFFAIIFALLLMGVIYNVPPIRTKDQVYLDVISESINSPFRLLLGWFTISTDRLPPSSIILAFWMGGAFLMAAKRFAEYRTIGDRDIAGRYRRSFFYYSENSLLLSCFFYAISSSFFLAIFLIKYRVEFLLTFPMFAVLFTWYLAIGFRQDSAAAAPERLYRETGFLAFVAILAVVVTFLFFVDVPFIHRFVEPLSY